MTFLHALPTVNACFNALSAVLLTFGYFLIRARRIEAHRKAMLTAFASSTLFLVGYLVYHSQVGSVRFQSGGTARTVYLTILISHTLLAVVVAPMAVLTLMRGLRGRFVKHRALARVTLPMWLYVNLTGVVVYLMLYHW